MHSRPSALTLRPDPGWALFLDVDGTLLDLRDTPDAVERSERVCGVLDGLARCLDGAVALVSGRPIDDLDALFRPCRLPAAGQHGLERRDGRGRRHAVPRPAGMDRLRQALERHVARAPGALLEEKSHSLAVHHRRAPQARDALASAVGALVRDLAPDMQVLDGDKVFEIKPRDADKGSAIRDFLTERPFCGRTPVFIGDDTTDEDGFAHVNAAGGHAIGVAPPERSAARWALTDVGEVVGWLDSWPALLEKAGEPA